MPSIHIHQGQYSNDGLQSSPTSGARHLCTSRLAMEIEAYGNIYWSDSRSTLLSILGMLQ